MPSSLFSSKQRPNKSGYSYIYEPTARGTLVIGTPFYAQAKSADEGVALR